MKELKKIKRKSRTIWIVGIALLLVLAGCGSGANAPTNISQGDTNNTGDSNSNASETKNLVTVKVGDTASAEIFVPFHLAFFQGYFEEEGIKIDRKVFANGPTLMLSMANGELDFAISTGFTPILQAASQGTKVKILASMAKGNSPVVASKEIDDFKDLDGKVVGTPGLGTIQNTMLGLAEKEYGIKFEKVIHGKVTDLPILLEKGEIDAFTSWEYVAADAVDRIEGAHYVLNMPVLENAESLALAVSEKMYTENRELVVKFMRAWLKGVKYYKEHPDEAVKYLSTITGKSEDVLKMALENLILDQPEIDMESLKFLVEEAIATGKISKDSVKDVDTFINQYVDMSILKELQQ